jgi:choline-sulfatase
MRGTPDLIETTARPGRDRNFITAPFVLLDMGDRPNLLFLVTDQQRYDWVGMNSRVPVRTPNIERLADRGVHFREAVCPSPLCGPSRACLASGMEYDDCGVLDHTQNYPLDRKTLYGRLRDEAGYHVMGCGKFDLHKPEFNWGVEGQHCLKEWGFSAGQDSAGKWATKNSWVEHDGPNDPYMAMLDREGLAKAHVTDFQRRWRKSPGDTWPTPLPEEAYADNVVADTGLELLADAPETDPWFLQVNFSGPHDPWDVTHDMHGWYRGENAVDFPGPAPVGETDGYTGEKHNEIRRNYAAMVENIDRHLGRYREKLQERGEWENTIIAFTSDHGEMLGDQGHWKKKRPYHPSVSVPLVIGGPGIRDGHVSDEPASVLDLHATALDYAELDHDGVDSRSLRPYLASETEDHRDYVYAGLGSWRMAYDGRYKLITGFNPDAGHGLSAEMDASADPLLFDRERDAFETTDVARQTPEVVERLRGRIETHRTTDGMDNQYTSHTG